MSEIFWRHPRTGLRETDLRGKADLRKRILADEGDEDNDHEAFYGISDSATDEDLKVFDKIDW
jgi:hypothetical protein